MSRKIQEKKRSKKARKTTKKRRLNGDRKRGKNPMVTGNHQGRQSLPKLTMAASLTITIDENKYQVMLQEKQSKRTHKRSTSCRSVTSLGNSQNTGSTPTHRTIVFGSLGPFPLPVEETVAAKK
ncbi:hypothetical protein MRB53_026518 [Persea americana]|uniref:Uncharacterized protein n=1 Tax=Persea americana TaxID=3435 RepID=A0ACC2LJC4_PERAE|nr:hypothetical protein MRB53_026518 [Persea americana]